MDAEERAASELNQTRLLVEATRKQAEQAAQVVAKQQQQLEEQQRQVRVVEL